MRKVLCRAYIVKMQPGVKLSAFYICFVNKNIPLVFCLMAMLRYMRFFLIFVVLTI